ncbi:hypothetical protein FYC77_09235 [Natrialba swarupiae]|uniref:Uncharacterized protein n=1 Tax=Natrialba swarupiae TaxID=2448032 RepID=A0A5D5AQP3_9EURY|nr:hypothetical protein FYC77_09235 [Natrialba swarupiae]
MLPPSVFRLTHVSTESGSDILLLRQASTAGSNHTTEFDPAEQACQSTIVTTETIHTLIADQSGAQVCNDVQWLL